MAGINFKALILSSLLAVILFFVTSFIINSLLSLPSLIPIIGVLFSFLSALPSFCCGILFMILFPALASFLYYKFNNSSTSMIEGALTGLVYVILKIIIGIIISIISAVISFGASIGTLSFLLGLLGKFPLAGSLPIAVVFAGSVILIWIVQVICCGFEIVLAVGVGAIVGMLLGSKKKSSSDWDDLSGGSKGQSKDSWNEKW